MTAKPNANPAIWHRSDVINIAGVFVATVGWAVDGNGLGHQWTGEDLSRY